MIWHKASTGLICHHWLHYQCIYNIDTTYRVVVTLVDNAVNIEVSVLGSGHSYNPGSNQRSLTVGGPALLPEPHQSQDFRYLVFTDSLHVRVLNGSGKIGGFHGGMTISR